MKYYHLTLFRNGTYQTVFCSTSSIEKFLAVDKELGNDTFVLYSRELNVEQYTNALNLGL